MRITGFILLTCLAIYALQIAFGLLVLAGLIFRTKETIGLVLFFGALALISSYPVPCLAIGAAGIAFTLYKKRKTATPPVTSTETPALIDDAAR